MSCVLSGKNPTLARMPGDDRTHQPHSPPQAKSLRWRPCRRYEAGVLMKLAQCGLKSIARYVTIMDPAPPQSQKAPKRFKPFYHKTDSYGSMCIGAGPCTDRTVCWFFFFQLWMNTCRCAGNQFFSPRGPQYSSGQSPLRWLGCQAKYSGVSGTTRPQLNRLPRQAWDDGP